MNVISFSLYGTDEKYWRGLLKNLELAPSIYPGWNVVVWCSKNCCNYLDNMAFRCKVAYLSNDFINHEGLFRRFNPASDKGIERFIVRDTDSRLNWRERAAVDEWIASGKPFHGMRDHDQHTVPIMGGMWGCAGGLIPDMGELIKKWGNYNKGQDQEFLAQVIWPRVRDQSITHDSNIEQSLKYFGPHDCRPFPPHAKTDTQYVGEVVPC